MFSFKITIGWTCISDLKIVLCQAEGYTLATYNQPLTKDKDLQIPTSKMRLVEMEQFKGVVGKYPGVWK